MRRVNFWNFHTVDKFYTETNNIANDVYLNDFKWLWWVWNSCLKKTRNSFKSYVQKLSALLSSNSDRQGVFKRGKFVWLYVHSVEISRIFKSILDLKNCHFDSLPKSKLRAWNLWHFRNILKLISRKMWVVKKKWK